MKTFLSRFISLLRSGVRRISILLLLSGLFWCGCARMKSWVPHFSKKEKPTPARATKPVATPLIYDLGKIARVDANARYVVMTFPLGGAPAMDQRLNVYRNGLKVAEVKVTGPQRDNNTVADIILGQPQVNDEVRAD